MSTEIRIDVVGKRWCVFRGKTREDGPSAYGRTLQEAVDLFESENGVTVDIPLQYKGFTDSSAEEYQNSTGAAG